jgi:hypothetical protein
MKLRLQATPGAILHEKILWEMEHVRTAAPSWDLVADSDGNEMTNTPALDRLLTSPYHEICFRLGFLPPGDGTRGGEAVVQQRIFQALRKVIDLRNSRQLIEPKIVWIFECPAADETEMRRARQIARQLCVDRFVCSDSVQF